MKRSCVQFGASVGLISGLMGSGLSHAARTAVVDVDQTDMLRGPQKSSQVLMHLKKGQRVTASNYPTEGYYKIRTVDGTLGWVKADTLELGPMPDLKNSE
jgi:uncharacterized protein YgiM (DUF1202 family)